MPETRRVSGALLLQLPCLATGEQMLELAADGGDLHRVLSSSGAIDLDVDLGPALAGSRLDVGQLGHPRQALLPLGSQLRQHRQLLALDFDHQWSCGPAEADLEGGFLLCELRLDIGKTRQLRPQRGYEVIWSQLGLG